MAALWLAVVSGWYLANTDFPYSDFTAVVDSPESPVVAWLRAGALSPAVNAVTGVLVVIAVATVVRAGNMASQADSVEQ